MKEISWGRAFLLALKYIVFIILWAIIGGIFILIGLFLASYSILEYISRTIPVPIPKYFTLPISPQLGILIGLLLVIIGLVITNLGYLATYFKLLSQLIVDTMKE